MEKHTYFFREGAAAFLLLVLILASSPVLAQCELPGEPAAAAASVTAQQAAQVTAMTSGLNASYLALTTVAQAITGLGLNIMSDRILGRMDQFWEDLHQALQDMTKQLASGHLDAARQMSGMDDSSNLSNLARQSQHTEMQAKELYQPTTEACRFDTAAGYLSRSSEVSKAVASGMALDFVKIGSNDKAGPSASGAAALQNNRWQIYQSKFCDATANNGKAGCTASAAKANMHVLPSKTIFSKETIDIDDADTREAVNQLMFNITGYEAPDPVLFGSFTTSPPGLEQVQTTREYVTQMDAVGGLAYAVVADRTPGKAAPEIKAMREKLGVTDASDKPSKREIRQSVVEQLWDPNYYVELNDSPSTVLQKEMYLKAYNLVMLYDMIAKQERISNVYAIETANMLDAMDHSRHDVAASAPLKRP